MSKQSMYLLELKEIAEQMTDSNAEGENYIDCDWRGDQYEIIEEKRLRNKKRINFLYNQIKEVLD